MNAAQARRDLEDMKFEDMKMIAREELARERGEGMKLDLDALEKCAQKKVWLLTDDVPVVFAALPALIAEVLAARAWLAAYDWNQSHDRKIHQVDRLRAVEHADNAAREKFRALVKEHSDG